MSPPSAIAGGSSRAATGSPAAADDGRGIVDVDGVGRVERVAQHDLYAGVLEQCAECLVLLDDPDGIGRAAPAELAPAGVSSRAAQENAAKRCRHAHADIVTSRSRRSRYVRSTRF